jgi:hypothetical protein
MMLKKIFFGMLAIEILVGALGFFTEVRPAWRLMKEGIATQGKVIGPAPHGGIAYEFLTRNGERIQAEGARPENLRIQPVPYGIQILIHYLPQDPSVNSPGDSVVNFHKIRADMFLTMAIFPLILVPVLALGFWRWEDRLHWWRTKFDPS